jgi:RimJ/RimL family protein N-acetyltransferase
LTAEEVARWYAGVYAEASAWVIAVDGRAIGTARLRGLDDPHRRGRFAIGIFDPAWWGRGTGTEATRLVVRHAFDTLRLHRVELRVLTDNHRAIAVYEKCGFVREGVERDNVFAGGEWRRDLFMSILEDEYRTAAMRR